MGPSCSARAAKERVKILKKQAKAAFDPTGPKMTWMRGEADIPDDDDDDTDRPVKAYKALAHELNAKQAAKLTGQEEGSSEDGTPSKVCALHPIHLRNRSKHLFTTLSQSSSAQISVTDTPPHPFLTHLLTSTLTSTPLTLISSQKRKLSEIEKSAASSFGPKISKDLANEMYALDKAGEKAEAEKSRAAKAEEIAKAKEAKDVARAAKAARAAQLINATPTQATPAQTTPSKITPAKNTPSKTTPTKDTPAKAGDSATDGFSVKAAHAKAREAANAGSPVKFEAPK